MKDYKSITNNSYNKNTKEFSIKFDSLTNEIKDYEMKIFLNSLAGKKILDLGCGAGSHANHFSNQGFEVTCIDISEEMIKLCKSNGLDAHLMDIENLDFKERQFDGVWSVTSLLHIPKSNIPRVIRGIHKILKENGILFICIKEGEGELFIGDKNNKSTKRFFAFWKKDEFQDIFKDKFDLIEFKRIKLKNTIFLEFLFKKR